MSFDPNESNIKLKAPDDETGNNAVSALHALNRDGIECKVVGESIPDAENIAGGHLQGVAIPNPYAILTTSAKHGFIMTSRRQGTEFLLEKVRPVQNSSHPGGIQTIGSYLVVPVYKGGGSEIRFYTYADNDIQRVDRLTIQRDKRALCVGITSCSDNDGEFYILAVCVNENEIDFYKTTSGIPLSDEQCSFGTEPYRSWNFTNVSKEDRKDWQPDEKWGGYPNSISLLSDEGDNVYFLGLHKTGFLWFDFLGRDYADLYRLDLDKHEGRMLTKLANFHAKCHNGTTFRWGGSALVTSKTTLRIFACERNVQGAANTKIRLNVFHSNSESLTESHISTA